MLMGGCETPLCIPGTELERFVRGDGDGIRGDIGNGTFCPPIPGPALPGPPTMPGPGPGPGGCELLVVLVFPVVLVVLWFWWP